MTIHSFPESLFSSTRQLSTTNRLFLFFWLVLIVSLSLWRPATAQSGSPPVGENRSLTVTGELINTGNVSLTGDFSISAWLYFSEGNPVDGLDTLVQGNGWSLSFAGGVFAITVDSLGGEIAATNTPIVSGRWAHYAVARTDGYIDVYINGNFETSSRTNGGLSHTLQPSWDEPAVVTSLFTGLSGVVDDFRIYNGAREQSQIQTDMTGDLINSSELIRHYSFDGYGIAIADESGNSGALALPAGAQFSGFLAPFVVPNVSNEFSEVQVAMGLELPTDLTFLPDGRMIVIEKSGVVTLYDDPKVVNSEAGLYLDLRTVTNNVAERGLLAVEVDPNFESNNYVYLYNTFLNQDNTIQKAVVRYVHVEGGGGGILDPASATIIWREQSVPLARAAKVHHGGGLAIAYEPVNTADPSPYKLYIVTSDESIPTSSNDLASDNGKVHRVNLTDGSIPTDNPYYEAAAAFSYNPQADVTSSAAANGVLTTIHSYGVRNGWRASYDQQTQFLFFGEVGGSIQSGDEDIHVAVPLADYGWPAAEGPLADPNDPGNPVLSWNHFGGPGRNDNPTDGTSSVTGGVVYRGNKFPTEYQGAYFYGDWARQWIRYAKFDFSGIRPVLIEDNFFKNSTGHVLSFEQGPDGTLYYLTTNQTDDVFTFAGQVNRLDFASDNSAPFGSGILIDDSDLFSDTVPHTVQFGANVYDSEGDSLSYAWDFGNDVYSSEKNPLHTFDGTGSFEVNLIVTDANGAASTFPTVSIVIGELPEITLTASQYDTYRAGDTITVAGFAMDSIDGTLDTGQNLTWSSEYFISGGSRPGPFENGTPYSTGGITFTTPNTGNVESFLSAVAVTLQAENSQGVTVTETLTLTAETSSITIDAPNEDVLIAIDGHITASGDYTFDGVVNFLFDFEAQASYMEGGIETVFSHWSDDLSNTNPVRQIAMPAIPTTITPVYAKEASIPYPASTGQVCYFDNADWSWDDSTGANFRTCTGSLGANFSDLKGHNNAISAISVGIGVHTIIYEGENGTGESMCISPGTDTNNLGSLSDTASSFEIVAGAQCPGDAPIVPTPASQVCYFDSADWSWTGKSGADFRTCAGAIEITNFSEVNEHDNAISAISVGTGVHTIIYEGANGTGESTCISPSTDINDLGSLSNSASSFEIVAGEQCPIDGPIVATPASQACYFDNADWSWTGSSGADFRTCTGAIEITNFSEVRVHDNAISAISVGTGVHTIIYEGRNGTGESMCIAPGTDIDALGSLSDSASSFEIVAGVQCPSDGPNAPTLASQACFFDNADWSWTGSAGASFRACAGAIEITNFSEVREHNNAISAISVGTGVHTIIYDGANGTGESTCISPDTDINALGSLSDSASSFEIVAGVQCPSDGPIVPTLAFQACYFDNADWSWTGSSGASFRACAGAIEITNFSDVREHNNAISAISVGTGVHTIIYEGENGTGESMCISPDTDIDALGSLSDSASSFEIVAGVQCPSDGPIVLTPASQVCFFDNTDWSWTGRLGVSFRACIGPIGITNFSEVKEHDNAISAISVGTGVHTIIYEGRNGTGESMCLAGNTDNSLVGNLYESASSYTVVAGEQCPLSLGAAQAEPGAVLTGVKGGAVGAGWLYLFFLLVGRRLSKLRPLTDP